MAISQVQKASTNWTGSSGSVSLPATATADNKLILLVMRNHTNWNTGPPCDTPTGWTELAQRADFTASDQGVILFVKEAAGGEQTVNVTGGGGEMAAFLSEYSGLEDPEQSDVVASNDSDGNNVTSMSSGGTATTDTADELVIVGYGLGGGISGGSITFTNGFTLQGEAGRGFWGDKIVSATGTQETTASWSLSRQASAVIVTLRSEGTSATVSPSTVAAPAAMPGLGVNSRNTLSTMEVTLSVPQPAISSGWTATPASWEARVVLPQADAVSENNATVLPAVINADADIPDVGVVTFVPGAAGWKMRYGFSYHWVH